MKLRVTVEGKTYEVEVEVLDEAAGAVAAPVARPAAVAAPAPKPAPAPAPAPAAAPKPAAAPAGGKVFPAPIAGTIRAVKVKPGDVVKKNQEIMTLEAMKMETAVSAPYEGTIKAVLVNVNDAVQSGQPLAEFE